MSELEERIGILDKLRKFHPSYVQMVNDRIADYTGLRWEYCLFECPLETLADTLQKLELEGR